MPFHGRSGEALPSAGPRTRRLGAAASLAPWEGCGEDAFRLPARCPRRLGFLRARKTAVGRGEPWAGSVLAASAPARGYHGNLGMRAARVMLPEPLCCETHGKGVWPRVRRAQPCSQGSRGEAAHAVPGVGQWGCRGEQGSGGTPRSAEPSPRGWALGHRHAGGQAGAGGAQQPRTGWADTGGGRGGHGSTDEAAGCCWVLLVPPKNGEQKENTLPDNRRQEKGIHPENCPLPNHCGFFSQFWEILKHSSELLSPGAQGPTGLLSRSGLGPPQTQPCRRRVTRGRTRSPCNPLHPGRAPAGPAATRFTHPAASWGGCEPRRSCRAAQLPFPASPACPDGVAPLDPALLYRA